MKSLCGECCMKLAHRSVLKRTPIPINYDYLYIKLIATSMVIYLWTFVFSVELSTLFCEHSRHEISKANGWISVNYFCLSLLWLFPYFCILHYHCTAKWLKFDPVQINSHSPVSCDLNMNWKKSLLSPQIIFTSYRTAVNVVIPYG